MQIILILIERYLYFIRPLPSNTPSFVTKTNAPTSLSHLYFWTYKNNNNALMFRLVLHIFQLLLMHGMIFWYFPNTAGVQNNGSPECTEQDISRNRCNEVPNNNFLFVFYALYSLYFVISSIQIREAWPEIEEDFFLKSTNNMGKIIYKGFYAIPFAWELQQVATWLWTKTSFDIFQWLKFAEIHEQLFVVKCTAKAKRRITVGAEVPKASKYTMGGGLLFGLIFLIIIPVFVFSSWNPMTKFNNITGASLSFTLKYNESKYFELMKISDALIEGMDRYKSNVTELKKFQEIKGSNIEQFQSLSFAGSSDANSFPTEAKIKNLIDYFKTTIELPYVILKFTFIRPVLSFLNS